MKSNCSHLDKSIKIISVMCTSFNHKDSTNSKKTKNEKFMKRTQTHYADGSERPSNWGLFGGALAGNANNIASTAMMGLFPPNFDYMYDGAIYSKNQEYIYNQLMNPNPEFYSLADGQSPDCSIYFCANYNPYYNFNNNFAASSLNINPMANYNSQGFIFQ